MYADKNMIDLVFKKSYFKNAVKFSPENNNITVVLNEIDNSIEISVIDNGIGMSPEVLEKISRNIFYSSKELPMKAEQDLALCCPRIF